jgi:hypothetical protein
MFIRINYLIMAIVAIAGCNNPSTSQNRGSNNGVTPVWANEYNHWKDTFPDSLVKHFPAVYPEDVVLLNTSARNVPQTIKYFVLTRKVDDLELDSFNNLEFISDSCLFPIHLRRNEYGFNYHAYPGCKELFPIPSEEIMSTSSNPDIRYCVIESNNKLIYQHDKYMRHYLPNEWKNGVSRGIGVSYAEKTVFYWLVLW